jgi:hypothetical protein
MKHSQPPFTDGMARPTAPRVIQASGAPGPLAATAFNARKVLSKSACYDWSLDLAELHICFIKAGSPTYQDN